MVLKDNFNFFQHTVIKLRFADFFKLSILSGSLIKSIQNWIYFYIQKLFISIEFKLIPRATFWKHHI